MDWDSDLQTWTTALSQYDQAIAHRNAQPNKTGLADLDAFVWRTLAPLIATRDPRLIHAHEYRRVVQWKLKRGRWRPRLQAFADATTDADVTHASEAAFIALRNGDIKEALAPLVFLKGCGPATASAILSACDPSVPYMSDELLMAAQRGKREYTVKAYMALIEKVRDKAAELTVASKNFTWTPRHVERAVFAADFARTAPRVLQMASSPTTPRITSPPASAPPASAPPAPSPRARRTPRKRAPSDAHVAAPATRSRRRPAGAEAPPAPPHMETIDLVSTPSDAGVPGANELTGADEEVSEPEVAPKASAPQAAKARRASAPRGSRRRPWLEAAAPGDAGAEPALRRSKRNR